MAAVAAIFDFCYFDFLLFDRPGWPVWPARPARPAWPAWPASTLRGRLAWPGRPGRPAFGRPGVPGWPGRPGGPGRPGRTGPGASAKISTAGRPEKYFKKPKMSKCPKMAATLHMLDF